MKNIAERLKKYTAAIKSAGLEGTVTYKGEHSHFVRCGCNRISLNTSEFLARVFVELQHEGKAVSGSTTLLENGDEAVLELIASLQEKLPHMPVNEHLPSVEAFESAGELPDQLLEAQFESSKAVELFDAAVHEFSADGEVSGAFTAGTSEYVVANTASDIVNGSRVEDFSVEVVLFLYDGKKELRSAACGNKASEFEAEEVLSVLRRNLKIKKTTSREDIEPGEYDIVFHADAAAMLTSFLGWVVFSGESYDLGTGMLDKETEDAGSKILGENITITDHPNDPETLYRRVTGKNGMVRPDLTVMKNGVLNDFYFSNRKLCSRYNRKVNNDQSSSSLKLHGGNGPKNFDELVRDSNNPVIYVPFIHYMNLTNSTKGEFTGVSRFGTFLIEDGKVKSHLYNLRINDSLRRVFNNVEWLSSQSRRVDLSDTYFMRDPSGMVCPELMMVKGVKITATSKVDE